MRVLAVLCLWHSLTAASAIPSDPPLPLFLARPWLPVNAKEVERRQTYGTDTTYTTTTTTVYVNPVGSSLVTVTETDTVYPATTTSTQTYEPGIATTTVFVTPGAMATAYTTTTRTTLTLSRATSTATRTTQQATAAAASTPTTTPLNTVCNPGDANEKEPGTLSATHQQRTILYVLGIYILGILITWHMVGFSTLLFPMKMLASAYHEFWHVLVGVCLGARLKHVHLDPVQGPKTDFRVDDADLDRPQPVPTYFVAMVGNALIGSLLVFCGFNTLASKIASFFIGLSFVAILWYASTAILLLLTAAWLGLMIGLWFINHALYLKYYVLFLGVMTALFFAWDIMDDRVFRKTNRCCPRQAELRLSHTPEGADPITTLQASYISAAWAGISILLFIGFILLAVYVFRQTPHGEYCQAKTFLPI